MDNDMQKLADAAEARLRTLAQAALHFKERDGFDVALMIALRNAYVLGVRDAMRVVETT